MRRIAAARTKNCVSDVYELCIAYVFANGDNSGALHFCPTIFSSFLVIVIGGIGDRSIVVCNLPHGLTHFGGCSCHCGSSMDGLCGNEEGRGSCIALFLSTNP